MIEDDLSMETVRRVKRGETFDPELRALGVFIAERRANYIWIRTSVFERGRFFTSSWQCHTEDEAVKWFNAYTELYGPPQRGEFLGFKYGNNNDRQVPETGTMPPMSCGS